jgi:hypothetical protein
MPPTATSRTATTTQTHRSTAQPDGELKIIQQQAGHDHASTTSIYTCVSSDFRTRTLRRALDATIEAALKPARSVR